MKSHTANRHGPTNHEVHRQLRRGGEEMIRSRQMITIMFFALISRRRPYQ